MSEADEREQDIRDAEIILSGALFEADTWYEALALLMSERAPA